MTIQSLPLLTLLSIILYNVFIGIHMLRLGKQKLFSSEALQRDKSFF